MFLNEANIGNNYPLRGETAIPVGSCNKGGTVSVLSLRLCDLVLRTVIHL